MEAVASSQRTQAGLVSFKLIGSPQEKIKDGRRYLKYEYESVLCQGTIVKGVNKDRCEAPEDGAELELLDRRHAITLTVTPEDTKGTPNEIQYLWVLDISAPTAAWGNLTEPITTVSESFELEVVHQLAFSMPSGHDHLGMVSYRDTENNLFLDSEVALVPDQWHFAMLTITDRKSVV